VPSHGGWSCFFPEIAFHSLLGTPCVFNQKRKGGQRYLLHFFLLLLQLHVWESVSVQLVFLHSNEPQQTSKWQILHHNVLQVSLVNVDAIVLNDIWVTQRSQNLHFMFELDHIRFRLQSFQSNRHRVPHSCNPISKFSSISNFFPTYHNTQLQSFLQRVYLSPSHCANTLKWTKLID
jgi:hypothetical protein